MLLNLAGLGQPCWDERVMRMAPLTCAALFAIGLRAPEDFDAYCDCEAGDREALLVEALSRLPTPAEQAELEQLFRLAAPIASFKRRRLTRALAEPWLVPLPIVPQGVSQRDLLLAFSGLRRLTAAGAMPTSTTTAAPLDKDKVRNRLAAKVGEIILSADLPAAALFKESIHPERLLSRFAGGRRTSTLKGKIAAFKSMSNWMKATFGRAWPLNQSQAIDYVLERGSEPCGHSVPASIMGMLGFFEGVGGQRAEDSVCGTMVKAIVADLTLELRAGTPSVVRKAHQLMACMIAYYESLVTDVSHTPCLRVFAWTKLVRTWGSLRSADMAGIPSGKVTLNGVCLTGLIEVSKTTGSGKTVGATWFYVSRDCWLVRPDWLEMGFEMFQTFQTNRKYLLPLPCKDGETFSDKEPTFVQSATASRFLLAEAKVMTPVPAALAVTLDGDSVPHYRWVASEVRLLAPGVQAFWSEHSDRATLTTWAKAVGCSKEECDYLGRWKPSESGQYVRNAKAVSLRLQAKIAKAIKEAGSADVLDEEDLLADLEVFLTQRNVEDADIQEQLGRLRCLRNLAPTTISAEGDCTPEHGILEAVSEAEEEAAAPLLSKGKLAVSLDITGRYQTIHRIGECWRVPGIHYSRFTVLDESELAGAYDKVCSECFPRPEDAESSEDESSSSSSSDS
jgi:hypothetical protein